MSKRSSRRSKKHLGDLPRDRRLDVLWDDFVGRVGSYSSDTAREIKVKAVWLSKGHKQVFDSPTTVVLSRKKNEYIDDVFREMPDNWVVGYWPVTLKDGSKGLLQMYGINMVTGELDAGDIVEKAPKALMAIQWQRSASDAAAAKMASSKGGRILDLDGLGALRFWER